MAVKSKRTRQGSGKNSRPRNVALLACIKT